MVKVILIEPLSFQGSVGNKVIPRTGWQK